jgi:hypothetical protein
MNDPQDIAVVEKLTDVLNSLHIAYAVGGSMASAAYGVVRFTQDADITVEPFSRSADKFYAALKRDFYISEQAMQEALQNRSSFNIIHLATAFKIDLFVQAENAFQKQMLPRSRKLQLGEIKKDISFVSPEDIVLLKLDWYNKSWRTSERQWSDVIGVLAAQANTLDYDYLRQWAKNLAIEILLQKAMGEACG